MAWAKLDDEFYDHPKVLRVSLAATGLYALCLSYAARKMTDGALPTNAVRRLAGDEVWESLAEQLVHVGLWEREHDGFRIHDFLAYNRSKAEVLADREQATEQRIAAGRARAHGAVRHAGRFTSARTSEATSGPLVKPTSGSTSGAPAPFPFPYPVPSSEEENPLVVSSKRHSPVRGNTALAADFLLTTEREAFATAEGCRDLAKGHAVFVDHWLANGKQKRSWEGTYRNWVRRAHSGDPRWRCVCYGSGPVSAARVVAAVMPAMPARVMSADELTARMQAVSANAAERMRRAD